MATYTLGKIGMNLRGTYDASATYNKLDVVTYHGSSYAALQSCTGVPVTNTEYWQMLCAGNGEHYSDNEVLTGNTWIDGKPIYRKLFHTDQVELDNGGYVFADSVPNGAMVISIYGTFQNEYGTFQMAHAQDSYWGYACVRPNRTLGTQFSGEFGVNRITLFVEYIKE